ncbi:adenylosuccinate lyase [Rickettsiella grylli]|uniref:adenylosuccinate lyase n=1 Tax=Rickettsiella grylli TaxID=59196 RepID=UPI0008FD78D6|nr:adenylosuccinate lyase [Rickettsiella grylli]OJA00185.1 adenylosuccinate lyase [Rickettsiella grylli]
MQLNSLTAISPIDGRYSDKTDSLRCLCSEYGLFYFRVLIEIRWLQTLAHEPHIKEIPKFSLKSQQQLEAIIEKFSLKDAERIKTLEKTTRHDIKAVEYFLKEKLTKIPSLKPIREFVHFACTSEDINNLSYALMLKEVRTQHLLPAIQKLITCLKKYAHRYASHPMLSRTHGQPAVPTTMGKELANFANRLIEQKKLLMAIKLRGKFNGAIGNYNAHRIAYPDINWPALSKKFVTRLNLDWNAYTTQIEPHDTIAEYCDNLKRINNIFINLAADCWGYISLGYFKQNAKTGEIGSSTMPHKINPIDFENAEGNLSLANSLYQHFSRTLPISRWQRDLRDSTLLRNLGSAFAYTIIGYNSLLCGLKKISVDDTKLLEDLNQHWEILAEAIQTVLRRYSVNLPYEQLKQLTQGKKVDQKMLHQFINDLKIPNHAKKRLLQLSPTNYLGYATELAQSIG